MKNNIIPKVSIIIPIFNSEKYISKCLKNLVINNTDLIEIILVDDGSTDNSPKICDDFTKRYSFIKTVHTQNKGVAHARNVGLDFATGEWIAWVDSDDAVFNGYVEIITKLAKLNVADIYEFDYSLVSENITLNKKINFDSNKLSKISKKMAMLELPQYNRGNFLWCRLFKSALLKDLRFPENNNCEDAFLMIDIFERASVFYIYSDSLYQYYYHKNSLSHGNNIEKNAIFLRDWLLSYTRLTKKLGELGYKEAYIYSKGELLNIAYHVENGIDYNGIPDKGEYIKARKILNNYKYYLSKNNSYKLRFLLYIHKNMYWLYKDICNVVYKLKGNK